MKQLFIELYLDEDVSVLVAELLRVRGFTVLTTQEAGHKNTSDEDQLASAAFHHRTLLTHNRDDFAMLAQKCFETGQKHFGIIIAVRRPAREIVGRLLAIINQTTADEMEDQVVYL